MSKNNQVIEELTSTMKIDPDKFSPITSSNRATSRGVCAGWLVVHVTAAKEHPAFRGLQVLLSWCWHCGCRLILSGWQ